jgi:aconitate hydratase
VPVDLVVDHSVQVDHFGNADALDLNMKLEFQRNRERYEFMKWGMQAFDTFKVVPPGIGIVHQVNLEYLAAACMEADGVYYPDTLVGTDSHTTMINGIGVVGWGVGGIEAEAGMLGQPVYFLTPDVVGVELTGKRCAKASPPPTSCSPSPRCCASAKVVGKFVEFFGEGRAAALSRPRHHRQHGARVRRHHGLLPGRRETSSTSCGTGRTKAEIDAFEAYFPAQGLFGMPKAGEIDYSQVVELDLAQVAPSWPARSARRTASRSAMR